MKPLLSTSVPFFSRRSMAAAAYDQKIYFFGGVGGSGTESILDVSNDLWCFDTTTLTWQQIPFTLPWPSPRRCVGWAAHGNYLLLWGGSGICEKPTSTICYTFLNDLWRFRPTESKWELLRDSDDHLQTPLTDVRQSQSPFPRYTPVFQSIQQNLFLFGGYTEDRLGKRKLNDAWCWPGSDGLTWFQIPYEARQGYTLDTTWPGLRYGSMSASDERYVYICGGFSDEGDHLDLWQFDLTTHKWNLLHPEDGQEERPPARYCAALAIYDQKLFLFGGRSRCNPKLNFNDLWLFDLVHKKWHKVHENREPHHYDVKADYPAYHAKAAMAVVGKYWYIWGGEGCHGHVSDFWRFDLADSTWQLIQSARIDDPVFW